MTNPALEAAAKAIEDRYPASMNGMRSASAARVAIPAWIRALTDRQAYNFHPLYGVSGWPIPFDCENNRHGERTAENRAALIETLEVKDG